MKGKGSKGFKGGMVSELGYKGAANSEVSHEPWMQVAADFNQSDNQDWSTWNNAGSLASVGYYGQPMDDWGTNLMKMSSLAHKASPRPLSPIRTANRFGILTREEKEEELDPEVNEGWNPFITVIKKTGRNNIRKRRLQPLSKIIGTRTVSQLNSFPSGEEWTKVEVTVDSGACETVMPEDICNHIRITPSIQSLRGDEYEVANGETVPNLGERRCLAMTAGSQATKKITFQCADIHKPLLSTACAADAGYETRLRRHGGYLEHSETGDRIPIYRRDNLYYLTMWIKGYPGAAEKEPGHEEDFARQDR